MKTSFIKPDLKVRNSTVESAYFTLIEAAKKFISSLNEEHNRTFVEIDHRKSGSPALGIHEMITPQFYLMLEYDQEKRYWISFGIEQRTDRLVNTKFLRLVFEHTRCNITIDCVRLDHVFLNAKELFMIALLNQPFENIDVLEMDKAA